MADATSAEQTDEPAPVPPPAPKPGLLKQALGKLLRFARRGDHS